MSIPLFEFSGVGRRVLPPHHDNATSARSLQGSAILGFSEGWDSTWAFAGLTRQRDTATPRHGFFHARDQEPLGFLSGLAPKSFKSR
jgi:hypothetical protein